MNKNTEMDVLRKMNKQECLCQAFLGGLFTPVFLALYFCTLLELPRECLRLVSCPFKLHSKDLEPNLKGQADYLKLLASFPIADECGAYTPMDPCLAPIEERVGWCR